MPMTLTPNHDRNSEMSSTTEAIPAIRSAVDQRAASNLYAGTDEPVDAAAAGAPAGAAAGGGVPAAGAPAAAAVELAPSGAPQLGQKVASSAASLWHWVHVCGMTVLPLSGDGESRVPRHTPVTAWVRHDRS